MKQKSKKRRFSSPVGGSRNSSTFEKISSKIIKINRDISVLARRHTLPPRSRTDQTSQTTIMSNYLTEEIQPRRLDFWLIMLYNIDMPQYRKEQLVNGSYYHIFSRSIAKYIVFNNAEEYSRFMEIFELYKHVEFNYQYSKFTRLDAVVQNNIYNKLRFDNNVLVEIVAFCLMPTHIHFLLKQVEGNGISKFIGKILNCYSRYFNIKHQRSGPLWSGRFKSVLISDDEQLLHLTRYIHLNPCSAELISNPENWLYSSYNDYISNSDSLLSKYSDIFPISSREYRKFVMNRKNYQKEISKIKNLTIDDYTG